MIAYFTFILHICSCRLWNKCLDSTANWNFISITNRRIQCKKYMDNEILLPVMDQYTTWRNSRNKLNLTKKYENSLIWIDTEIFFSIVHKPRHVTIEKYENYWKQNYLKIGKKISYLIFELHIRSHIVLTQTQSNHLIVNQWEIICSLSTDSSCLNVRLTDL